MQEKFSIYFKKILKVNIYTLLIQEFTRTYTIKELFPNKFM